MPAMRPIRGIRFAGALTGAVVALAVAGCGGGGAEAPAAWHDPSITDLHPLGWLGGRAHPVRRHVETSDPDAPGKAIVTGGMVIAEAFAGAPLAGAGAQRGDVIVRVGKSWLPNREDPSLDLFRFVESEISAGVKALDLTVLRDGALAHLTINHDLVPLEVGLPGESERFALAARRALDRLASAQAADGTFPGASARDDQLTICAIAGLAFAAGGSRPGEGPHAVAITRCRDRVQNAFASAEPLGAWPAAWGTMLLAELAGPLQLDAAAIVRTSAPIALPAGAAPAGAPVVVFTGAAGEVVRPEEATLAASGSWSGPQGEGATSLTDLPEGAVFVSVPGSAVPSEAPGPGAPAAAPIDGPLWTLDDLAAIAGADAEPRLAPLASAVARLGALQLPSGGWDPDDSGASSCERTLATNQALLALGMAQRAGAPVREKVIRDGVAFIRKHTNDGHVFAVDDPAFDRRREAGRASGAAAALLALGCVETDEFLRDLAAYADKYATSIPAGGAGASLHVLNTAIQRRARGLDAWAAFFEEFRHLVASLQDPDGAFAAIPGTSGHRPGAPALDGDPTARTATWALVAALQSEHVPVLAARAVNPLQVAMSSDGTRLGAAPIAAAAPPGAMDEEAMRKALESMGVDPESVKVESPTGGGG